MEKGATKLIGSDDTEEGIIIDGGFEDVSDLENDLESQINSITQEFGGQEGDTQFKINIYRILENKGERAYLFSCLPNELPIMDKLINDYGGGTFDIWIYKNGKIFKRKKVIVEQPIKIEPEILQQNDNAGLSMVMQGLNKLTETLANNTPAQVNQSTSMKEMLEMMALMKGVMGFDNPQPQNDLFSNFKKFAEMQQIIGSSDKESNSNDVFMKMMETFGEPIAKLSENMMNGNKQNIPTSKQLSEQNKQPVKSEINPMKMHLIFLTGQAKANNDPMPYAQMVIDNTPDKESLKTFITGQNAVDEMAKIHSPVADYSSWFLELGECITEILNETGSDSLTDTGGINNTQVIENKKTGNDIEQNETTTNNGSITGDS